MVITNAYGDYACIGLFCVLYLRTVSFSITKNQNTMTTGQTVLAWVVGLLFIFLIFWVASKGWHAGA